MDQFCDFDKFEKKCVNNQIFRAMFVADSIKAHRDTPSGTLMIEKRPPLGLGVKLSETAKEELRQMMNDYLDQNDILVARNSEAYPHLYEEVKGQCTDVISSI